MGTPIPRHVAVDRKHNFTWATQLRLVGRAGLLYAKCSRAETLARQPVHLAAASKPLAALCGTIPAVCIAQKLYVFRPTVDPIC